MEIDLPKNGNEECPAKNLKTYCSFCESGIGCCAEVNADPIINNTIRKEKVILQRVRERAEDFKIRPKLEQQSKVRGTTNQDSDLKEPFKKESDLKINLKQTFNQEFELKNGLKQEVKLKKLAKIKSPLQEELHQELVIRQALKQELELKLKEFNKENSDSRETINQKSVVNQVLNQENPVLEEALKQKLELKQPLKEEFDLENIINKELLTKETSKKDFQIRFKPTTKESKLKRQFAPIIQRDFELNEVLKEFEIKENINRQFELTEIIKPLLHSFDVLSLSLDMSSEMPLTRFDGPLDVIMETNIENEELPQLREIDDSFYEDIKDLSYSLVARTEKRPKKVKNQEKYNGIIMYDAADTWMDKNKVNKTKVSNKNCNSSYRKANQLIAEIESCFNETTNLVERTLETSCPVLPLHHLYNDANESNVNMASEVLETCQKARQIRESMEEAIDIFDSLICDKSTSPRSHVNFNKKNSLEKDERRKSMSMSSLIDESQNFNGELTVPRWQDDYINPSRKFRLSVFDAEIDELFKECYDMASIEPSTSLDACLKNLENLCIQLKEARNNIVAEMKSETFSHSYLLDHDTSVENDELFSEAVSLLHHNRFSIINEIIERKLKKKRQSKRFSSDPPLIGLEGKTHKMIAEVPHEKTYIENSSPEENFYNTDNNFNSYNTLKNNSFSNSSTFSSKSPSSPNSTFDYRISTSETNRSGYIDSYSSHNDSYNLSLSTEENNNAMSHEETLALYEDNQKLQESLLSILHSLNDIHNNFLQRRRLEAELSRQSSNLIHNKILTVLSTGSDIEKKKIAHDYVNFPLSPNSTDRFSLDSDFEAIENIVKISEELKNLWMFQTPDFSIRKPPMRTKSFSSRFDTKRRKKKSGDYSNIFSTTNYHSRDSNQSLLSGSTDSNLSKCFSMPNLMAVDLDTPTEERLDNLLPGAAFSFTKSILRERDASTPADGVRNFIKQLRIENEKCYLVTLNFLKKVMQACKSYAEEERRSVNWNQEMQFT